MCVCVSTNMSENDHYYDTSSDNEYSDDDNESNNDRRSSSMVPFNRKNSSIVNRKYPHENREALSLGNVSTFGGTDSNGGDSVVVLTSLIQNAVNSGNNNAALYFSNSLKEINQLSFKRMDLFCDAVNFSAGGGGNLHQSSDQRLPQYNSSQFTMVNTSNSSRSPSEDFNVRRIYSNNVFSGLKQAHVSDKNYKHIVSLKEEPFIKGNILHNVFQMLLRIKSYWIENDMVVEDQDYEMREFIQRRETKHPKKEKAHLYSTLYVDKPSIDMNDIISNDVSLIENLIRFLYHLTSNYAYFVMENEDEDGFKDLSKSVCLTRLKNLKKEFPKRTDYIKANNMDDVSVYQHRGTGKCAATPIPFKQIVTDGSEKYLSMYQNKDLLTLPFIRKLYQWMLEKYIFCLSINVESDDLYVTIENNNYPIIKENHNSGGDGQRMNYRTIFKHILSLLGLYEPLKSEINVNEFDFFDMLGIQTKVDGRKNNGKQRKRKRSSDSQEEDPMTGNRKRRKSTEDYDHDDDESSSDNESSVNDLED